MYKFRNIKRSIVRKIETLLIPLLLYRMVNVITSALWANCVDNVAMISIGGLWFIYSIFIVNVAFILCDYIMGRFKVKQILIGVIACSFCLFGLQVSQHDFIKANPWVVQTAVGFFFFYIGNLMKPLFYLERTKVLQIFFGMLGLLLLIIAFGIQNDVAVRMYRNVYGSPGLFIVRALMGCIGVACVSISVRRFKPLEFCGQNTLAIMAVQFAVYLWVAKFVERIINFEILGCFPIYVLYIGIVIIISCFVALLIDKYIPIMAGHGLKRKGQ